MSDNFDFNAYDQAAYGAFWTNLNSGDEDLGFWPFSKKDDCSDRPMLTKGSGETEAIKELQGLLGLAADGVFGGGTEKAVSGFQSSKGLPANGTVDSATWITLCTGKTPAQRQAAGQAAASVGIGLATEIIGAVGKKKRRKGKKKDLPAYLPPADTGPNLWVWVGVPVLLIALAGGGYLLMSGD